MGQDSSDDRFAILEKRFSGYEIRDSAGERVGEVDNIFVDDKGRPEYVGVKTGIPGAGRPLIPLEANPGGRGAPRDRGSLLA